MNDKKIVVIGIIIVAVVVCVAVFLCSGRNTNSDRVSNGINSITELEGTANAIENGIGAVEEGIDNAIQSVDDAIAILTRAGKRAEQSD